MAADGVWKVVNADGEESGSVLSMESPSQVGSVATPGAASSAAPAVPRDHCFGAGLCPWCMLTCGKDEHGRLDLAVGKYHQAQAEAAKASCQLTMVEENCIMGGLRLMLLTCAMQVHNRGATAADQNTIGRLQLLGILPPTDSWNKVAGCAPPSPPGAPATAMETDDGAASEADKKKTRSRNRQWWLDPPDADWRKADWITHDAARARIIKVMGDKKEWIELPPVPTAQLLAWHDTAQPGDTIKGVTTDLVRNHAYDYTYEGGCWLSQRNPDFPDSRPRHVQVAYVGDPLRTPPW